MGVVFTKVKSVVYWLSCTRPCVILVRHRNGSLYGELPINQSHHSIRPRTHPVSHATFRVGCSRYQLQFTTPPRFPVQSGLCKLLLLLFFSFFSSFLLEERCRFLSNFTTSTAEVELPGEFLMPKANTVSILWIIILSLRSIAKEDSEWQFKATITEKSSDTFASLGRFPIHTGLTPPLPHKQC